MVSKNESELVAKMRKAAVAEYGSRIMVVKYHGSQFSQAGVSDLLVCLDGLFAAVEVKDPRSHNDNADRARDAATPKQLKFIEDVQFAGGSAAVCVTVEEFMEFLEPLGTYWDDQALDD